MREHVAGEPDKLSKLSSAQYQDVERLLAEWKRETLDKARRHPSKGYKLGIDQLKSFATMAGHVPDGASFFGGESPTTRLALQWLRTRTLHEFEGTLDQYADKIRSAVLYGTQEAMSPLEVGSLLYHATHDAEVNWRMVARTEMVRANNAGRIDACKEMGFKQVWVPPHMGACAQCKRLIENKVFDLDELRDKSNYGKHTRDWVPCIPLHPLCRHSCLSLAPGSDRTLD